MVISNLLKTRIQRMEDKNDLDGLIEALYDENESIRIEAVDALGRIGDPKAVEPLIMNFTDENKNLRTKIAASLGKIGDNRAVQPLINALTDKEDVVKEEAIIALGKIKDEKAVKYLIKMLNNKNELIKADAVTALGSIGSPKAVPSLIKLLDDNNDLIHEKVVMSLGMISIHPYITELESDDEKIRINALKMLKNIGKSGLTKFKPSKHVKHIQNNLSEPSHPKKTRITDENSKRMNVKKESLMEGIPTTDTTKPSESTFTDKDRIFNEKKEFIISEGFHSYIENFVLKASYKCLENYVEKIKYCFNRDDVDKLRELFALKGIELDQNELNWLIQDEIKKQEYEDFKTKIQQNNPQTLKQHIKNFIKNYPHNQQQHTHHLQKLLKEKNLTKPNQNIKKLIKNTEKEIKLQEFQNYLTNPHQNIKKIEKELLEDLSLASRENGGKYFNLGKLFYDMDIPLESIKFFEKILETDLYNLDVLNWKGLALYRLGKSNEAANLFNKIINLNSGYLEAWINLGVILHEAGKIRDAEMSYYSALKRLEKYNKSNLCLNYEIFRINPYAKAHFEYFVNLIFSNYAECESSSISPIENAIEIIKKNKYETDLD